MLPRELLRSIPHMAVPMVTAALWAAAAASAVYWVLQWPQAATPRTQTPAVATPQNAPEAVTHAARALGQATVQPTAAAAPSLASARLKLMGVIASPTGQGSALIAIDGLAPKAYTVGQRVQDGLYLQSLEKRQILMGPQTEGQPPSMTLTLPDLHKLP